MTSTEWLDKARLYAPQLRELLKDFHPSQPRKAIGPITAPQAEDACEIVRRSIAAKKPNINPVVEFNKALAASDIAAVNSLLNEAWFGLPETTACWRVPGFNEAIELMENMLEEGE